MNEKKIPNTPAAVSAIILAGGESTRLGRDKAFLQIGGRTLIERTTAELAKVCDQVFISSNNPERFQCLDVAGVVPDVMPGLGPLGGIHAGLRAMANEYGFFVACDMPLLDAGVLRDQVERLRAEPCDAVVPRWDGRTEPLHAIYGRACLPAIERCIGRGERKIIAFYDDVRVAYWELRPLEKWERYFHNINTEDDLRDLRRLIKK
ncbi:MAG: molybdenum cofactor guanylyltransferase [Planctomycetes bacterium]|nr:molybdenum cofactor guanylyltransferase [Planctomycetota bacterium]